MVIVGDRWVGDSERCVVVLAHGGGQTRHSWEPTAQRLAAGGYGVVTYDARGHGGSGWDPAGDYSRDAFADDLLGLISTLERPPVLVGASLGGTTCLLLTGEHPDMARALVLVDVVVQLEEKGVDRIRDFMTRHADGFGSLEEVADAVVAYNPLRPRPLDLDGLRKNVRQREDGRWYWHWDPAFMNIGDEPRHRVDVGRLRAAAARVTVPVLVVRGMQSDIVSDAGMADMLQLIPGAASVEVTAAGHMVAGDDNDVFVDRLEAFLSTVAGCEA